MDAYVIQPSHADHLLPVWHALDPAVRGHLFVGFDESMRQYVSRHGFDGTPGIPPQSDTPVLVASGNELPVVRYAILLEHGVGQTYGPEMDHVAWPGGVGRDNVRLFVCPNERVAEANRARYPHIPCAVVGSPHVELLRAQPPYPLAEQRVAISCHWEAAHLCPELRSGFAWFENEYRRLCEARPEMFVMHGHPRHQGYTKWKSEEWGIEFVPNFSDLTQRAWAYVTDNSSTLYEWAALGRPVVVVSPPWYRESATHGLRFNEYRDVGPHVREPADLESAISVAIADPAPIAQRRQEIVRALFGEDLSAGAGVRAARAVEEVIHATSAT